MTSLSNEASKGISTAEILELLARSPKVDGIDLNLTYFEGAPPRVLLAQDYVWQPPMAERPQVPLQLCEFLAYKTALAYESDERIRAYLTQCCDGIAETDYQFFDSSKDESDKAGKLADAQGYGFVFQNHAYVLFRGTESRNDWKINSTDTLTSDLGDKRDARSQRLRRDYGALLDNLGPHEPGRHVGFSIAYAAIKGQVDKWLDRVLAGNSRQVIYSGHSLGGAMAQLAAYDRARSAAQHRIAGVVTFGAPMVGNAAFASDFKARLGDRAVLLESSGDLVPKIMQRWYYRMLYPLRQRAMAGLKPQLQQSQLTFAPVSTPWRFSSEPPLSHGDILGALRTLQSAAEEAGRKRKEQDAAAQSQPARPSEGTTAGDTAPPASEPGGVPSAGSAGAAKSPAAGPSSPANPAPTLVYWVVGGVVVIAVAGVAWYFVRRKLFSHDIQQRYALYLSTLSYQQLRANCRGDLSLADRELDAHLHFVRGDITGSKRIDNGRAYFDTVQSLPLRVKIEDHPSFAAYLKSAGTFI